MIDTTLNEKELQVLMKFMVEYYEYLSRQICNDWDFPDDWTDAEKLKFVKEYHEYNGDPEEFDPEFLVLPDFSVLGLLYYKLAKQFNIDI